MSDIFESKWGETKAALTEGLAGNKKKTMDVVLENTKRYLAEQSTAGATSAGNVATLNRVILPVIRRVMPTVIANEIVGVQPMTGPVGQIHTLRIRYADTVSSNTTAATIDFTLSDSATSNQTLCKISPQASVGTGDAFGGILRFFTSNDSGSTTERLRLMANGRLENQSPTNSGNVLQDFRIDFRNENNAGIMAGIGCVRTANANAPGAFVIRTSTDVDSSSNSSDGEISEKFRVAANGDLTATDTSISSNSDSRLKENISDFSYDLDKFKALKTKTFDWKNPKLHGEKSGQRGFIAQDIETVDDYWIEEIEVPADSDDFQYLEDRDIFYTENCTIPEGKKVGDLEYKARFAKTSKLGQKDAMYVSVIQQLIKRIEALESK